MPIIIFLFMNFTLILSSFFITYRLFKLPCFIGSLTCWFICYLAQIILVELVLGILAILYLKNVILLNLAILLIIWLIAKNRSSSFDLSGVDTAVFLKNKIIFFIILVILSFGLIKCFINLLNPPFGWDSLNYHFTFAVEWLKHGNLDIPITIFDDPSPSYYPINGSLFYLWLILPLKNVFLADLGQIPFFILSLLAIYNISKKIGLNRELSFYACALFLLTPNIFKQLQIAYVDVMVAGLFLASINFLFLLNERFSLANTLIYSMSLGVLLGTKTIGLPYSILLFIPFLYLALKNIKKSYFILLAILVISLLGGFSYFRNFIETANPLYPLDFSAGGGSAFGGKLLGKTIFKGVIQTSIYRAHFKIEDYALSKLLFHEGLGMQTAILILPAIFIALPVTLMKKKSLDFNLIYFLILPILVFLVYRYIIPLANTRYLYPALGIGNIIGFYTAKMLKISRRVTAISVAIFVLACIPELAKRSELVTSIIFTLLLFFLSPFLIRYIKQKYSLKKPFLIFSFSMLFVFSLILLEKDYVKNEYPRYIMMVKYSGFWPDATRAWNWLNMHTSGNNVAYAGRPVPFPLYGTNFKNNVSYVSLNKTEPAKLHYFTNSRYEWGYDFSSLHKNLDAQGNYRWGADYSTWVDNLSKRDIDYLFVYSLHQIKGVEFPMEDIWAKASPDRFSPVFANETIHIYKILK